MSNPIPICNDPTNPRKLPYPGLCYQHYNNPDNANIPFWQNVTLVEDYNRDASNNPITASGIPPYVRLIGNVTPCNHSPGPCGDYVANNTIPLCNAPTGSDYITCLSPIDYNCYKLTTSSLNLNVDPSGIHPCRKLGFKNVYAQKHWQGRYGYQSENPGPPALSASYAIPSGSFLGIGGFAYNGPDQVKYLGMSISSTAIYDQSSIGGGTRTDTYTQETHIDRFSGIQTLDSCNRDPDLPSPTDGEPNLAQFFSPSEFSLIFSSIYQLANSTLFSVIPLFVNSIADGTSNYSATYDGTTLNVFDTTGDLSPAPGTLIQTVTNNFSSNFSYQNYSYYVQAGVGLVFGLVDTTTVTISNTSINLSFVTAVKSGLQITITATCTLNTPYTANDVQLDGINLLDEWDLSDDLEYPPREDGQVSMAPSVYYSEMYDGPLTSVSTFYTCSNSLSVDDVDGNPANGQIYGSPLPVGYGPFWNGAAENDTFCINDVSGLEIDTIASYGGYSPYRSATRWTSNNLGGQNYGSSWIRFSDPLFQIQKEVEIKQSYPSYNFIRPCGWDRWEIDNTIYSCVEDVEGSDASITVTTEFSMNVNNTDFVYLNSSTATGVYIVASGAGSSTLTLTNQNWTDSPTEIGLDNGGDYLAKMRFPTCPGTCGILQPTSVIQQDSSSILISFAADASIQTGDALNLTNILQSGTTINTPVSYSIDNNSIVIKGQLISNFSINNAAIQAPGPIASIWNDNTQKGSYLMAEWSNNFRDIAANIDPNFGTPAAIRYNQTINGMPQSVNGLNITQYCAPPISVCNPYYIGFTPNDEFDDVISSNVLSFPLLQLDGFFGNLWQATPIQSITDPLYQTPARPCSINEDDDNMPIDCQWAEDNGLCNTDTCSPPDGTLYYPLRPYVEAINLDYSAGLPTLFGIQVPNPPVFVEYYSLGQLSMMTTVVNSVNVATPSQVVGETDAVANSVLTPWVILNNQTSCVCNGGVFADIYETRDGVGCPNEEIGI